MWAPRATAVSAALSPWGRSGSKWMESVCEGLDIPTRSQPGGHRRAGGAARRGLLHLTDELYESKIVYRTEKFEDLVRTFCMNPHGVVVNENTNGIVTVNGHSYEDKSKPHREHQLCPAGVQTSVRALQGLQRLRREHSPSVQHAGRGVMVQRFGDLVRGRRSTVRRIEESFVTPTLAATPGDLSLVIPKRILDGIIEMIYALDKIAPGTANDDTLLYGVEVKFYNMEVEIDNNLETSSPGLFVIGDCSGVTHSLSHASASGVHVARHILGIRD